MNGDLETIYMELLQMREELQSKLFEYASLRSPAEHVTFDQAKRPRFFITLKKNCKMFRSRLQKLNKELMAYARRQGIQCLLNK